jgi:hypothetical protein
MPVPQGWDPALILAQMLSMQCIFHLTLSLFFGVACFLGGTSPALSLLFDPALVVTPLGMAGLGVAAPAWFRALGFSVPLDHIHN